MARPGSSITKTGSRKDTRKENAPLAIHVRASLERYFSELNGQDPSSLYELVLCEVEQPLLEVVLSETRGNISKAAEYLGMNRATLRKKLQKYGING